MADDVPFEVLDNVEIGDLTEVKEQRFVLPAASGVKMTVDSVKFAKSKDESRVEALVQFRLIDGLPEKDVESGEETMKYAGSRVPQFPVRLWINVTQEKLDEVANNPEKKEKAKKWWATRQWAVQWKYLLVACGVDPSLEEFRGEDGKVKSDELIAELVGKEIRGNILQAAEQAKVDGDWKDTGTFRNDVRNFKQA